MSLATVFQMSQKKLFFLIVLILLILFGMYQLILEPHVTALATLRQELNSQQELLNSKAMRSKAISMLEKVRDEYHGVLSEINSHFYTESEADVLAKTLPDTISDFGNQIILLKPKATNEERSRSSLLVQQIRTFNLPREANIIDFLASNEGNIDADENAEALRKELLEMLPEEKREYILMVWQQAPTNKLAGIRVEIREMEIIIQGEYKGLIDLLAFLGSQGKTLEIPQLTLSEVELSAGKIQTNMVVRYYVIH
ncbi:MAG: hypothetical protein AAB066_03235 [Candidatus Margulisiibacteriota bacterium]